MIIDIKGVTTALAIDGDIVYTANVTLFDSEDTVVTMTVTQEGLEDKVYTITIKEEETE